MIVQELQTGSTLFYVSPSAPASADNILELKAQESSVRGQVGWSQQSSENSRPLTICGAYDPTDFTDVQTLPTQGRCASTRGQGPCDVVSTNPRPHKQGSEGR